MTKPKRFQFEINSAVVASAVFAIIAAVPATASRKEAMVYAGVIRRKSSPKLERWDSMRQAKKHQEKD